EAQVRDDDHGCPKAADGQEALHAQDDRHNELDEALRHPHAGPRHEISAGPAIHFPVPPRPASSFVPLDPNSPAFLSDLKTHYFPDTPHDPASLSWLQDPTTEENEESPYNPTRENYSAAQL